MRANKGTEKSLTDYLKTGVVGATGRLLEATFGYPLNVIRMQYNANPHQTKIIRSIWQQHGVSGFYKGFGWDIMPICLRAGFGWVVTKACDNIISTVITEEQKTLKAISIGLMSPAITNLIFTPFGRMQTWVVTDSKKTTLKNHIAKEGFFDLWRAARVSYLRTTTVSITFNVVYVNLINQLFKMTDAHSKTEITKTLYLAAVAGLAAAPHAIMTTPIEMMKDQMQKSNGIEEHRIFHAAKLLYQRYGLWGIFRTAPIKVVRSGWYFAFTTAFMYKFGALPNYMLPPAQKLEEKLNETARTSLTK